MPRKRAKPQDDESDAGSTQSEAEAQRKRGGAMGQRRQKKAEKNSEIDFYASALSEAERILLPEARQIEGLDEEIAVLRMQLRNLLAEKTPEDIEAVKLKIRSIETLLKAVVTKYRLSPKAEEDLSQSIKGVLEGIGGALGLGEFDGTR